MDPRGVKRPAPVTDSEEESEEEEGLDPNDPFDWRNYPHPPSNTDDSSSDDADYEGTDYESTDYEGTDYEGLSDEEVVAPEQAVDQDDVFDNHGSNSGN